MPKVSKWQAAKNAKQEFKDKFRAKFKGTGKTSYGFPRYTPGHNENDCRGVITALRDGDKDTYGWSRFQTATAFENRVFSPADLIQLGRGDVENIDVEKYAASVVRRLNLGLCEWFLKACKCVAIQEPNTKLGFRLYRLGVTSTVNHSVDGWYPVDPLQLYGLDLSRLSMEIAEELEDDLNVFLQKAQQQTSASLTWIGKDGDGDDDVQPTLLSEIVDLARAFILEVAQYFEDGLDAGDSEVNQEFEKNLRYIAASDKKRNVHSYRLHGWSSARSLRTKTERDAKVIPLHQFDRPEDFKFHTPTLYDELLGYLGKTERTLLGLCIARAALGKKSDFSSQKPITFAGWRYAPLLQSDPNIGKSVVLESISRGIELYGGTFGQLPNRLDAGFGLGVFTKNMVLKDDMTAKDFNSLSTSGIIKSAISGSSIQSERKGKDAVEVESTAVLFMSVNEISAKDLAEADEGIRDRVIHLRTKLYVDPSESDDVIPCDDPTRSNGIAPVLEKLKPIIDQKYPRYSSDFLPLLGAYLVSCALERHTSHLPDLANWVRTYRQGLNSPLNKSSSTKKLGRSIASLTAIALGFLVDNGKLSDEQAEALCDDYANNRIAVGAPQIGLPLYLSGAKSARLIPNRLVPKILQPVLDGTFRARSTMVSDLRNGTAVKVLTGNLSQSGASKAVSNIIDSTQVDDYLPTRLDKLLPIINQECRAVPHLYAKLRAEAADSWKWLCAQIVGQSASYQGNAADHLNSTVELATSLLNCLA